MKIPCQLYAKFALIFKMVALSLNASFEFLHLEQDIKVGMFEEIPKKRSYRIALCLLSPLIALGEGLLTIALRILQVIEPVIKGLMNIFGALFTKDCQLITGVKQLVIYFPISIFTLILAPIEMGLEMVLTPVFFLILLPKYCHTRTHFHNFLNDNLIPR